MKIGIMVKAPKSSQSQNTRRNHSPNKSAANTILPDVLHNCKYQKEISYISMYSFRYILQV
jgi:hypothetical protein